MRTLLITLLIFAAPTALAAPSPTYAPGWEQRSPQAWGTRQLAGEARYLDDTATRLYREIYSRTGRSELASRAGELVEATRDLRRQAERGAGWYQLRDAYQRVGYRYAYLERRFDNRQRHYAVASLNQVEQALRRVGGSLQRYAYDRRDDRRPDRYAYNPRDPNPGRWDGRDDDGHDHDERWTRDRDHDHDD